VKVSSVDPTGTAAESGIRKGDILVAIQHTPVSQSDQALQALRDVASSNRHFAAVLVRHDATLVRHDATLVRHKATHSWIALELPDQGAGL
jgi:S1-C subfamily serine protease